MKFINTPFGVSIALENGDELPIRHIIGIGRNYAAHAHEQDADIPDRPMIFTKNPAAACLDGATIVIPSLCRDESTGGEQVDFEAELAVIIGHHAKDVSETNALDYVLGYCCANDVSARWWQKKGSGGQFCRGKSFDTFCPLGPIVVARERIKDMQNLGVVCRVNGQEMQNASTSQMIFPVKTLIAELSRGTTLLPGTVILTGTPGGVGMARKPPVWLKAGDIIEVEVESIGVLRNVVAHG